MTLLPRTKWKMRKRITPQEAAAHTYGNTDKFMNKDFWVIRIPVGGYKSESDVPIGSTAIYYHDTTWWLVDKVRN